MGILSKLATKAITRGTRSGLLGSGRTASLSTRKELPISESTQKRWEEGRALFGTDPKNIQQTPSTAEVPPPITDTPPITSAPPVDEAKTARMMMLQDKPIEAAPPITPIETPQIRAEMDEVLPVRAEMDELVGTPSTVTGEIKLTKVEQKFFDDFLGNEANREELLEWVPSLKIDDGILSVTQRDAEGLWKFVENTVVLDGLGSVPPRLKKNKFWNTLMGDKEYEWSGTYDEFGQYTPPKGVGAEMDELVPSVSGRGGGKGGGGDGIDEDIAPLEEIEKFYKLPENQRQAQTPQLKEAAQALQRKEITKQEFDEIADTFYPAKLITEMPEPPHVRRIEAVLGKKVKSRPVIDETISKQLEIQSKEGKRFGTRLDIPAYNIYDTWVVTVHGSGKAGKALHYSKTAYLTDVVFMSDPSKALKVATGDTPKQSFARMEGRWKDMTPDDVYDLAAEELNKPNSEWVQIGMNPYKHSYFYDKKTMQPILSADEVIQVGPLVLARNVKRGNASDFAFEEGGVVDMRDGGRVRMKDGGGLLPNFNDAVAVLLKDVVGKNMLGLPVERTMTEENLNSSTKEVLKDLIRNARSQGRSYITWADYGKSQKGIPISGIIGGKNEAEASKAYPRTVLGKLTFIKDIFVDPKLETAMTIGGASFSEDEKGITTLTDIYDAEKFLFKSSSTGAYGAIRDYVQKYLSTEEKGGKAKEDTLRWSVNLGKIN